MQHSSGSGQSAAAGSILPTQQQLHEIYEENLRLREEVVKTSTAGGGGPASAEAAAARNQVCHIFLNIVGSILPRQHFVGRIRSVIKLRVHCILNFSESSTNQNYFF